MQQSDVETKHTTKETIVTHADIKSGKQTILFDIYMIQSRVMLDEEGEEFTLTFEDIVKFCKETGYDKLKGRETQSLSIDRIRNELGYVKGNIRAITVASNASKGDSITLDPDWFPEERECPF